MSSNRGSRKKKTRPPARQGRSPSDVVTEDHGASGQNTDGIVQQISYSGPLPAPEAFAKYEATLPGAAREILDMAKKEQGIRETLATRELEIREGDLNIRNRELDIREKALDLRDGATTRMLRIDNKRVNLSFVTAFVTSLIMLAIAGLTAWQGNALIAVPLGVAGVIGSSVMSVIRWLDRRSDSSPRPPLDH